MKLSVDRLFAKVGSVFQASAAVAITAISMPAAFRLNDAVSDSAGAGVNLTDYQESMAMW